MKSLKLILASSALFALSITLVAQQAQPKPWPVPDNFKTMKNPIAKDDASVKTGMTLYNKNCASCHGKTGLGDGVKARALKTFPGDLSKPAYQTQADGEQFYRTKFGRGEMPKYEGKMSDTDIWHMVNYMRTFKK